MTEQSGRRRFSRLIIQEIDDDEQIEIEAARHQEVLLSQPLEEEIDDTDSFGCNELILRDVMAGSEKEFITDFGQPQRQNIPRNSLTASSLVAVAVGLTTVKREKSSIKIKTRLVQQPK
ncbi:hypothetical protein ADUPG1_011336 [Aduncisulcus paluster]|uniref:Uncharacterized protein n=1 Tax=Aduncisulcus paluster TaxID=2918883 RepID=A0ABQ5JZK0_9EUKA|nr:hypothetical protein ADUPG1_011336 [Aduncisulcus paluster]